MNKWVQICTGFNRDKNGELVPCRRKAWADGKCKRHHEEYQHLLQNRRRFYKIKMILRKAIES